MIAKPRPKGRKLYITDRDGGRYARLLAHTIKHPDEIWMDYERNWWGRTIPLRRYLARWMVADDEIVYGVAVFEFIGDAWQGVETFASLDPDYVENQIRVGERVYVREE